MHSRSIMKTGSPKAFNLAYASNIIYPTVSDKA